MVDLLLLEKRYDGSIIVFTSAYVEAEVMWCFIFNGIPISKKQLNMGKPDKLFILIMKCKPGLNSSKSDYIPVSLD